MPRVAGGIELSVGVPVSSKARPRLSFIEFQSPTLVEQPPEGEEWIHEVKHDGYRTQLIIERGEARAFTRNGYDWSARYRPIIDAAAELPVKSAILDGEMIVMNEAGISDVHSLLSAMRWEPGRLAFVAFDLLHLDGTDLRLRPLVERRAPLAGLIEPGNGAIQFSQHVLGSGAAFFREADRLGLEGIVSKRAESIYRSGPSKTWLKTKCYQVSEFAIAGVHSDPGRPPMALMATVDDERKYVGSAFIGLKQPMRERLWQRAQDKSGPPARGLKRKGETVWLKPGLIGRVRHLKGEQALRHATLQEIREES